MTSAQQIAGGVLATVLATSWAMAQADGGRICVSERAGPWQIAVFTSPTPPSLGLVDVSVLVQDEATHQLARSHRNGGVPPRRHGCCGSQSGNGGQCDQQAVTIAMPLGRRRSLAHYCLYIQSVCRIATSRL